jgi:hypothetical protein
MKLKQEERNYKIIQSDGVDSVLLSYSEVLELREIIDELFEDEKN